MGSYHQPTGCFTQITDEEHVGLSPLSLSVFAHRYSAQANLIDHKCECCREKKVSVKQVELTCTDGTKIQHSYTVIDECQCLPSECEAPPTTASRRRRRWPTDGIQPLTNSTLWPSGLEFTTECVALTLYSAVYFLQMITSWMIIIKNFISAT